MLDPVPPVVLGHIQLLIDGFDAPDRNLLLSRTAKLLEAARTAGVMVIYVVVGFRPGFPEVSDRNPTFHADKQAGRFAVGEAVVTKHRVNAFAGTDLQMILRANGIETLLLAGIATRGVVLSTLRHAANADYRLVVGDCCLDKDDEVYRVLIEKIFPRQASVVSADGIAEALA